MLENQIPFRVLELLISSSIKAETLKEAINDFIDWTHMTTDRKKEQQPSPGKAEETSHLLGLLRARLLSNGRDELALSVIEKSENRLTKFRNCQVQ